MAPDVPSEDIDRPRTERQKLEERLAAATDEEVRLVAESRSAAPLLREVALATLRARGLEVPDVAGYRAAPSARPHRRDARAPARAVVDPLASRKLLLLVVIFLALLVRLLTWSIH